MIPGWQTNAWGQIGQFLVLLFYVLIVLALGSARRHLPPVKHGAVFDVCLVVLLLIYAVALHIFFST